MTLAKEDLLAISQLLDTKLKSELQPLKDEIRDVKLELENKIQEVKLDLEKEIQDVKLDLKNINLHLENEIQNINLHLENVTDKNIQLLAENYLPAAKRYEEEIGKIEAIQQDVDILKKVVAEHSEKLQKIS